MPEVSLIVPDVVGAAELAARLQQGTSMTLLDARFTLEEGPLLDEFTEAHLPGAVFVDVEQDLSGPRSPQLGSYPVPSVEAFEAAARRWGVSSDTWVVAYAGFTGISAGRLTWLLRWFGHNRVSILSGGLQSWVRHGYPVAAGPSARPSPGDFVGRASSLPVADVDRVLTDGKQGQLVDVRSRRQYSLQTPDVTRSNRRPGRIPGAVNLPATTLHRRNGQVRDAEEIRELLQSVGVDPRLPVSVYCGGGIASAWAAYVLQSAGVDAALFATSWAEYVVDLALPVEVEQKGLSGAIS